MSQFVLLYVPCPSMVSAKTLARSLLDEGLIACANLFPVTSLYRWKGEVVDDSEVVLVAKTLESFLPDARSFIESKHPYDVPAIISLEASANDSFFEWLSSEINAGRMRLDKK